MKTIPVNFRATPEEKAIYQQAAINAGLSLTGWIKEQLDTALLPSEKAGEVAQVAPEPTISPPPMTNPRVHLCPRCTRMVRRICGVCRSVVPMNP